jgi:hypothetical protein
MPIETLDMVEVLKAGTFSRLDWKIGMTCGRSEMLALALLVIVCFVVAAAEESDSDLTLSNFNRFKGLSNKLSGQMALLDSVRCLVSCSAQSSVVRMLLTAFSVCNIRILPDPVNAPDMLPHHVSGPLEYQRKSRIQVKYHTLQYCCNFVRADRGGVKTRILHAVGYDCEYLYLGGIHKVVGKNSGMSEKKIMNTA